MTARKQKRTCGCRSDARGDRAAVSSPTAASPRLTVSSRTRGQFVSGSTNGTFAESCAYDPLGRRASTTDKVVTVYPGFTGTATTCFAIKDHLGSVQYLVDSTGSIKEQYRYDAWGNVRIMNANSQTISVSAYGNRVLFHGGAYSAATGLYQFRARWYSPELGRWLSPDPIGLEGGLNLYEFCANNPVNFRDPSGLSTYRQNRVLTGILRFFVGDDPSGLATTAPIAHTFIFTRNDDGTLGHTYSWGNEGSPGSWFMDRDEDREAAKQALCNASQRGDKVGSSDLDSYIDDVYQQWKNDPSHQHRNLAVARNCKWEADQMIAEAHRRLNEATAAQHGYPPTINTILPSW